ncbi:MAG: NAD-dependent epimerase/dehydratase family protein [Planctomycetota bacterium]
MEVLVTGASGFLGRHLVRALREAGHQPRALVRSESYSLERSGAKLVQGDVLDPASLQRACEGVDAVAHLAGKVEHGRGEPTELYQVHIEGTRNVLRAAAAAKVSRVLHLSSSGTIAVSTEPKVHDEQAPYALEAARGWPYYLSKIYAERLALEVHARGEVPVVVLNPSLLLGPEDERLTGSQVLLRFLQRELAALPPGGVNFLDVRDCATACVAALERGRPGERYLLGGPNMTFEAFFVMLSKVSGVRAPGLTASRRAGGVAARLLGGLEAVGGLEGDESTSYELANHFWYLDASKARRELGFAPRNPEATLRDAVSWLRGRGPLPEPGEATFGALVRGVQRALGRA